MDYSGPLNLCTQERGGSTGEFEVAGGGGEGEKYAFIHDDHSDEDDTEPKCEVWRNQGWKISIWGSVPRDNG